jgi:hypothetical protein
MSTDTRVFSKRWKAKHGCLTVLGPVACWVVPWLLVVLIALKVVPAGHRSAVVVGLAGPAVMAGVLLGMAVQYLQPWRGNRKLRGDVAAKVRERDGVDPGQWGAPFVGWSPGPEVRNWEGEYNCDVGFLFLGPSHLTYLGDSVSFSLRREGVWRLDQSVGAGPWIPAKRILVGHTWPDGYQHFLTFGSREPPHLWGLGAANRLLFAALDSWWRGTAQLTTDPPAVPTGSPETGPELPPAKVVASGGGHALAIFGGVAIGLVFGVIAGAVVRFVAGVSGPLALLVAFLLALVVGNIAGIVLLRLLPRPEDKSEPG